MLHILAAGFQDALGIAELSELKVLTDKHTHTHQVNSASEHLKQYQDVYFLMSGL